MSTTDLEKEKLALADKQAHRKVNTLGADYSVHEEPFGASSIVLRDDIFSETPTAASNFASPDYGDDAYGGGAIGTRHIKARLHPVLPSGISSSRNVQTFMAVHSVPESDDPVDVERVRIKHLIPPELSPGRGHAADVDVTTRGFELALFPALDVGGTLDAYDSYGPIPISTDPSAVDGIGSDARWSVDYANGVVRLSGAPISGTGSVFNPFNTFGNRDGTTNNPTGRLTLFATFYQYTGPSLTDGSDTSIVTVGDGTDSYGNYYGPTSSVMQMAVDSLAPFGGTVFVKEGNYAYAGTVHVPANVRVVGLSHRAHIKKPGNLPAFRIHGNNASVEGLSFFGNITGGVSRGAVSINVDNINEVLSHVKVKNNHFWVGDPNEPAIEIHPLSSTGSHNTYRNLVIEENMFRPFSTTSRLTYITEFGSNGNVSFGDLKFLNNDFGNHSAYAIDFSGSVTEKFEALTIADSYMSPLTDIRIDTGLRIEQLQMHNNREFGSLELYGLDDALFDGNVGGPVTIGAGGAESCVFANNLLGDVSVDGYVLDTQIHHTTANKLDVLYKANNLTVDNSTFNGPVSLQCDSDDGPWNITNVRLSENRFLDQLYISNDLTTSGTHSVQGLKITGNVCDMGVVFGTGNSDNSVSVTYKDVLIEENTLAENADAEYAILLADDSTAPGARAASTYTGLTIRNNTLYGDVRYPDHLDGDTIQGFTFSGNRALESNKGLFIEPSDAQRVEISGNRLTYIKLFEFPHTLGGNLNVNDLVIDNNKIRNAGAIVLSPNVDTNGNTMTVKGLSIKGNTFEGIGLLNILATGTFDYRLVDAKISDNLMPWAGSYLGVFGTDNLGGSNNVAQVSVKDNDVNGTIFVGGGTAAELQINGNSASDAIHLSQAINDLAFEGNSAPFVGFNGDITGGVINDNQISTGMELDSNFFDVVMDSNRIDGYLEFHSDFTDSAFDGNAIGGALTFATATRSTYTGNTIDGTWDNTTWSKSTAVGNTVNGNMTVSTLDDSIISNTAVNGNLTATTLTDSKVVNNTVENTLTVSTMVDSDVNENTAGVMALTGTLNTSHVDNNISRSTVTFSASVTDSTVNGNVHERMVFTSPVSNCVITGNTGITAGGAPCIDFNSTVSSSTVTSNVWECSSATTDINFGALTDVVLADNRLLIGTGSSITFTSLTRTRVANCLMDTGGAGDIGFSGGMVDSSIEDCELDSTVNMATSAQAMVYSHLKGCHITGALNITSTNVSDSIMRSIISNNVIEGNVTIGGTSNGSSSVLSDSSFNDNVVSGAVVIEARDTGVNSEALNGSNVCNNTITGNLDIDYDATSATPETLIAESVIEGNAIQGSMLIAQSMTTAADPVNIIRDSVINNNRVETIIDIAPSGRSHTSITYNHFSFSNNVCDSFTIYGAFVGSTVVGNTTRNTSNSTNVVGQLRGTTFSGNMVGADGGGNLTLGGGLLDGGIFNGNTILDTLTVSGALSSSVMSDNFVASNLNTSEDLTSMIFSDNRFVANLTFSGTIDACNFEGNIANSLLFDTGSILTDNTITGNRLTASLGFSGTSHNNTVIGNNSIDGAVSLASTTQNTVTMVGNHMDGLIFTTAINDLNMVANVIEGTLTFSSSLTDSSISANDVTSTALWSGALNETRITNNHFSGSVTLPGVSGTDSVFSNNTVIGAFLCSSGGTYTRMNMTGNSIDDTMTFSSVFSASVFNSNIVSSTALFNATAPTGGGGVQNSVIDGNAFQGAVTISTTGGIGTETPFLESTFSGNKVQNTLTFTTNDDHAMMRSTVTNNTVNALTCTNTDGLSTILSSSISNNVIQGALTINNTTASGRNLENSTIMGNHIGTDFTIGSSNTTGLVTDNSTISGNSIISDFFGAAGGRSASSEAYRDSVICDNTVNATMLLRGLLSDSMVINNQVDSTFSLGNISDGKLANNIFAGAASTGTVNESGISNNEFRSSFTTGAWTEARFNGNRVAGAFSGGFLTSSNLNGNIHDGTFTSDGWVDVTCAHNTYVTTFTASTSANPAIRRVTFSGNVCKSSVTFTKTTSGGTDNFRDSTFNGNVFQGLLTIGGSAANEFAYLTFTGNSGEGSITLDTSSGSSELDGMVVVGNTMSGTLTFADGPFSVPSSGHGSSTAESVYIVALNTFGTYTGITFTNHAIGWGNASGANTGTTVGGNY